MKPKDALFALGLTAITAHAYFGLFPTSSEQQARDAAQRAPYAWWYLLFPIIGILPFYESTREQ